MPYQMPVPPMKRYERYADEIAQLIATRALRPGDRLPSVRQASTSRKLSPSTVFEAYYLLEARGLIRARPRSGYYVSARPLATTEEPRSPKPAVRSTAVEISDLVFQVLGSVKDPDVVPLGSAFPGVDLFPLDKLARCLSAGMRKLDPARIVDDLPPGNERLRRQIALRYLVDGFGVDADEIIVTSGALEALNLCLQAVTRPGDVVVVESPDVLRRTAGARTAGPQGGRSGDASAPRHRPRSAGRARCDVTRSRRAG